MSGSGRLDRQWRKHGVKRHQVIARNRRIDAGAPRLWALARRWIDDAAQKGLLDE